MAKQKNYFFLILSLSLIAGICLIALVFYNYQVDRVKKERQAHLNTLANIKVQLIERWLNERLLDADASTYNKIFINLFESAVNNNADAAIKKTLDEWFTPFKKFNDYNNFLLLDKNNREVYSFKKKSKINDTIPFRFINTAKKEKRILFSDLYNDNYNKRINLDLIVPVYSSSGNYSRFIGTVLLRIDPNIFFYPLVQTWDSTSRTNETLIIKKSGDSINYLSNLRFYNNRLLSFKLPTNKEKLIGSKAVRGFEGVTEGIDYRSVPVLAAIKKIKNTDWFMVAKVDIDEVYAPLRDITWLTFGITIILLIAVGILHIYNWKKVQYANLQKLYQIELHNRQLIEQHRIITKYSNDVILLMDSAGQIVEVNDKALNLYCYSPEEIYKMNIRDLRPPENRQEVTNQMRQVEASNGLIFETEHIRKDGRIMHVEVSSRLITIDNKKFFQSIIRDITERKKYDEELKKFNRTLKVLSECNQVLVRSKDEKNLLDDISKIISEIGDYPLVWIGYLQEDKTVISYASNGIAKDYVKDLIIKIDDEKYGSGPSGQTIKTGNYHICSNISEDPCFEAWREAADIYKFKTSIALPIKINNEVIGTLNIYSYESNAFNDEEITLLLELSGDISYGIEVIRLAEDNRQAAQAIAASEKKYRELADMLPQIIFEMDMKGKFNFLNKYSVNLYNFTPERMKTLTVFDVVIPEEEQRLRTRIGVVVENQKASMGEYSVYRNDGTVFPALIYAAPIIKDGKTTGIRGSVIDITERKIAEDAIHLMNRELEERVVERTASLEKALLDLTNEIEERKRTESELSATKDELQIALVREKELSQLKSRFISMVSHEYRTPLTVIFSSTDLLAEYFKRKDSEGFEKHLERIRLSVKNMVNLLENVLIIQRSDSGKMELKPENVDFVQLFEEIIDGYNKDNNGNHIIEFIPNLHNPLAFTDRKSNFEIINKLLSNAIKFAPDNSKIKIELFDNDKSIIYHIADKGRGLSQEDQNHLFEPFYRGMNIGITPGTGLGLAIVKRCVDALKGKIELNSERNRGTTVVITIPRKMTEEKSADYPSIN